MLRDRGFGLSAIGSPIGKIRINEPFEHHLERFERALDLADFYECPRIRVFSYYIPRGRPGDPSRRGHPPDGRDRPDAPPNAAVTLFLENEKGIYGDTAARVAEILETVDSPASARLRPGQLPRSRPVDRRGLVAAPALVQPHPRQGLRHEAQANVPAGQGDGQIPRLIAEAVPTASTASACSSRTWSSPRPCTDSPDPSGSAKPPPPSRCPRRKEDRLRIRQAKYHWMMGSQMHRG